MYSVTKLNSILLTYKPKDYLHLTLFIAIAIKIFGGPLLKIAFLLLKIKVVFILLEALLFENSIFSK